MSPTRPLACPARSCQARPQERPTTRSPRRPPAGGRLPSGLSKRRAAVAPAVRRRPSPAGAR
eukprot:3377234-Lingulodinium_polyedra.AAC.1